MTDSRQDQPTIVEILSAYVRVHAPRRTSPPGTATLKVSQSVDVQAALTVLGRRNAEGDKGRTVDLTYTDLRAADLRDANLAGANLAGVNLRTADLRGADLRGADLSLADLSLADLRGADLSLAALRGANLACAATDPTTRLPIGMSALACPPSAN